MDLKPCAYQIVACNMYNIKLRIDDVWTPSGYVLFNITRGKNVNRLVAGVGSVTLGFVPVWQLDSAIWGYLLWQQNVLYFLPWECHIVQATKWITQAINQSPSHMTLIFSHAFHWLKPTASIHHRLVQGRVQPGQELPLFGTPSGGDLYPYFSIIWRSQRLSLTLQTQGAHKILAHNACIFWGVLYFALSRTSLNAWAPVSIQVCFPFASTRVATLIVATIYLQLIQNRYMFRSFTVLHCSHQHCVQPVASDVEVVGYL